MRHVLSVKCHVSCHVMCPVMRYALCYVLRYAPCVVHFTLHMRYVRYILRVHVICHLTKAKHFPRFHAVTETRV